MPASSEAKNPTENTEPKIARMRTAPMLTMMPSMIWAPTRDHQPASSYPRDATVAGPAGAPNAPGGGGEV